MKIINYRINNPENKLKLPLTLKASGHYTGLKGWQEYNNGKNRNYVGLFWALSGKAEFMIGTQTYVLEKEQVLYYLKFESHSIRVLSDEFCYYWATFDGTQCEEILKAFQYSRAPFHAGPPLVNLFNQMYEALLDFSPAALRRGGLLVYQLLQDIGAGNNQPERAETERRERMLVDRFVSLVAEEFSNKELNVSGIADILCVHRSTLNRLLRKHLNATPVNYLKMVRLQTALRLLYSTDLTAEEIGKKCGIADPSYFSKLIRKQTGKSPAKFRNSSVFQT